MELFRSELFRNYAAVLLKYDEKTIL